MPQALAFAEAWDRSLPLSDGKDAKGFNDYVVTVVHRFTALGCTPDMTIEWLQVAAHLNATLEYVERGYTPAEFEAVRDTHFSRYYAQLERGHLIGQDPEWLSWMNLVETVDAHFLILPPKQVEQMTRYATGTGSASQATGASKTRSKPGLRFAHNPDPANPRSAAVSAFRNTRFARVTERPVNTAGSIQSPGCIFSKPRTSAA